MIDQTTTGNKSSRLEDYFALKDGGELVNACLKRFEDYASHVERTGRLSTWKRAYKKRYVGTIEGSRIRMAGDKNQFLITQVNHLGNICNHIINNITGSKQNITPRATNSDFQSLAQTKVARNVLTYYTDKGLEDKHVLAADICLTFATAYLEEIWNPTDGNDIAVDQETKKTVKDGDVNWYVYSPLDVAFDTTVNSSDDCQYRITRKWENKWELAAKYPQYEQEILSSISSVGNMKKLHFGHPIYEGDSDLIPVYTLIHEKNDVIPEGRFVRFIDSGSTVLIDNPLPHKKILHRICAQEQPGNAFGTSVVYDLLPLQENLDMLESTVATNQAMFGVQTITGIKGAGTDVSFLDGGLRFIETNPMPGVDTRPASLNLLHTDPEIFKQMDHLIQQMEILSGVNSVMRGQPEASLKSGSALALVASQAIQFLSGFQRNYINLIESVGTSLIDILKNYAKAPRLIAVAGKYNTQYIPQFTGQDISDIDRVTVEVGNPLAQTTAGRLQIAQDLLRVPGMIKDANQYLSIIETGTMETLVEGESAQLLLIKEENEALLRGENVIAVMGDDDPKHVLGHNSVLANLDARKTPNVVQAVLKHNMMHIQNAKTMDPILAGMLQLPVLNAPQPPPPPPGPQAIPPKPGQNAAEVMHNGNPVTDLAHKVKLPNMPQPPQPGQR